MTAVFGPDYAGIYDALYRTKDYLGEVDLIERLLARYGTCGPSRILDLGCGTGNHALPLARRGHRVTAVDSSPAMLAEARAKAALEFQQGASVPTFVEGDVRHLELGESFSLALMMFTVLGYQYEESDFLSTLAGIRKHLEPGGLLIFDIWNGSAVLAQRPQNRVVEARDGATQIIRRTHTRLDVERHLCYVHFDIERKGEAGSCERWEELHIVRYFFQQELSVALCASGFALLDFKGFPDGETPPDERAWNVIGVAQVR